MDSRAFYTAARERLAGAGPTLTLLERVAFADDDDLFDFVSRSGASLDAMLELRKAARAAALAGRAA